MQTAHDTEKNQSFNDEEHYADSPWHTHTQNNLLTMKSTMQTVHATKKNQSLNDEEHYADSAWHTDKNQPSPDKEQYAVTHDTKNQPSNDEEHLCCHPWHK